MKNRYALWTGALAASILMSATAFAASPGIIIERNSDSNNANVYITGVPENTTSVEFSLKSKNDIKNVHFIGSEQSMYSHHKADNGTLTIYVDSLSPLESENGKILLGSLTVEDNIKFSDVTTLITLDDSDSSSTYTSVSLEDDLKDTSSPDDNENGSGSDNGSNGDNGSNSGGSSSGGSSSGGSSSGSSKPSTSTDRPTIVGEQTKGMIVANDDGSVTIHPHNGYKVKDVLVNGVSQGSVLQLLNLKSTDKVEVIFEAVTTESTSVPTKFSDVPSNSWYAESVSFVTEKGLFSGVSETEFAPSSNMTRGMLVSVLYRLDGSTYTGKSVFTDVEDNAWYTSSVSWAYENGIVSCIIDTEFAPNAPITREQAAVMLHRYLKFAGIPVSSNNAQFKDGNQISSYAAESVGAMQNAGLISGDDEGNFRPKAQITRAEISSIFMRLCQKYGI